jgi:hypothetical protein
MVSKQELDFPCTCGHENSAHRKENAWQDGAGRYCMIIEHVNGQAVYVDMCRDYKRDNLKYLEILNDKS